MMDGSLIFSVDQLKVMLLGCGYMDVCGIRLDDKVLDNNTVIKSLSKLVNSGVLKSDGQSFVLDDRVKEMIHTLGKANDYNLIHTRLADIPDICCYCGSKILVCSSGNFNKNKYSFSFLNLDKLIEKLCSEGYLPGYADKEFYSEKEAVEFEKSLEFNPNNAISQDSPIIFSIDMSVKNKPNIRYMRIIEYYFFSYILFSVDGKKQRCLYTENSAKKIIKELMEK